MKRPVGRPPRLFTCNTCGKVLGSAAVRSHKCEQPGDEAMREFAASLGKEKDYDMEIA